MIKSITGRIDEDSNENMSDGSDQRKSNKSKKMNAMKSVPAAKVEDLMNASTQDRKKKILKSSATKESIGMLARGQSVG